MIRLYLQDFHGIEKIIGQSFLNNIIVNIIKNVINITFFKKLAIINYKLCNLYVHNYILYLFTVFFN